MDDGIQDSYITRKNDLTEPSPGIDLYPNPVTDNLVIKNGQPVSIKMIEIITASGNTVIIESAGAEQSVINLPVRQLRPGIYFVRITYRDNTTFTKKIIKQ